MSDNSIGNYTSQYQLAAYFSITTAAFLFIQQILQIIFITFTNYFFQMISLLIIFFYCGFIIGLYILTRDISPVFSNIAFTSGMISIIVGIVSISMIMLEIHADYLFIISRIFEMNSFVLFGMILISNYKWSRKRFIAILLMSIVVIDLITIYHNTLFHNITMIILLLITSVDLLQEPEITLDLLEEKIIPSLDYQ